jgi:CheY-like chemotaxis protein
VKPDRPPAVLVIEDTEDIREAFVDVLSFAGYEVFAAIHGRDALDRLENGLKPDLIVTDLMMPVMNGYEFLQAIRQRPDWASIPVVIVSANRNFDEKDLGVTRIVRKPVTMDTLLDEVRLAASQRKAS